MLRESGLLWWHLGILTKKRYELLLARFGDLDTPLTILGEELLRELRVRDDIMRQTLERAVEFSIEHLEARMHKAGIGLVTWEDDWYPLALREIPDPPMFLSYRGDLAILNGQLLALIGTRRMTHYGRRVTNAFVEDIVRAGMITVSGLAIGIDTRVAEETLRVHGKTVAVLGHGLALIATPERQGLADKIVETGGLLLSESPLTQQGSVYSYPARNRIIAGLSKGTVVLEAPLGSGAIITADLALEYNRDVFAVPGQIFDPNYAGCHRLLASGHGHLVTSAEEVLRELGYVTGAKRSTPSYEPQSDQERTLYNLISGLPKSIDELVEESRMPASIVGYVLTMLQLAGAANNIGSNKWIRA